MVLIGTFSRHGLALPRTARRTGHGDRESGAIIVTGRCRRARSVEICRLRPDETAQRSRRGDGRDWYRKVCMLAYIVIDAVIDVPGRASAKKQPDDSSIA